MENSGEIIEKRKNNIKKKIVNWFKEPSNKILAGILLFAFIIRLYYFVTTLNQPLWWDEACYGSLAKNLISHAWDSTELINVETMIRPIFFPVLWSFLLRLGANESIVRFTLEFIPSVFSVFFVYLVGKELYSKRVGLISSFIFSVLWIHLFYTARLLTNVPALLFLFSSVYFFIKATKQDFVPKLFAISLFLLSISTLIRYPNGIVFFVYFFMLIINKKFLIRDKNFWISGLIGISPLLFFFAYNQVIHGNIFPAMLGSDYIGAEELLKNPLAFHILNMIPIYLKNIFFPFFLLGTGIIIFELGVGYNFISKNRKLQNNLFLLLMLIAIYSFFIFYMRGAEDRWLFATSLPLCCIAGFGIDSVYLFTKKYNMALAIFGIIAILLFGAYGHVNSADDLIENKKTSYLQIKQGFEWFNANTPKETIVAGTGIDPYAIYYSENQHILIPSNESESEEILKADYLVYHFFTPQQDYIPVYLDENKDKWQAVNAFFFDQTQQQPSFIIYQKNS